MKRNGTLIGFAIVLIAIITSCAKAPQAEIDATEAAMDSLTAWGADIYSPDEFEKIKEVYDGTMDVIKEQESKTFKSYGKAKEGLAEVVALAEELKEGNAEKKAEILEELEEVYEEAAELNNDNKNNIPKKGGASRVMAFQKDVDAIANDLDEVAEIMEEDGNLIEALEMAKEILEDAEDVSKQLATAVASSPAAKKPKLTKTKTSSMSMGSKKKK